MKYLKNDSGIALITALMITLLSLVIVMSILYVVTQGIKTGASRKVYRNAVEAAYGGTNVMMYELFPRLANAILATSTPTTANTNAMTSSLGTTFSGINLQFGSTGACLNQKLQFASSTWTTASICPGNSTSMNPKDIRSSPDMTFQLQGTSGQAFRVYSKIVDTVQGTAYMSGGPTTPLLGGGVTESAAAQVVSGRHFVYRIEVVGEKVNNPSEQGNLSVLYEY
jgi:hypothetical protein